MTAGPTGKTEYLSDVSAFLAVDGRDGGEIEKNAKPAEKKLSGEEEDNEEESCLLEEIALEKMAENYVVKHQLEIAIEENLKLRIDNEILTELDEKMSLKREENSQLIEENKVLIIETEGKMSELRACMKIIESLEKEITQKQEMEFSTNQGVVKSQNLEKRQISRLENGNGINMRPEIVDLTHLH